VASVGRKRVLAFVLSGAALGAVVATAAPAGAQQYPPEPCIVTVSDSTVEPGQTIDITAGVFSPGTEITVTMTSDSVVLGTATVGESGTAALSAVVPAGVAAGEHTIAVNGVGCAAVTVSITAAPATTVTPAGAAPRSSASGDLPRTGGDTFPVARVGGALVAFGAGLVLLARQRRRRASTPVA
jgi:LPXTG-motif cell wall-anchored protein